MTALARPQLVILDGKITTTSNQIAEHFNKRHDRVLRAIDSLECSPEFRLLNFGEASHEVKQPNGGTVVYRSYTITRDGFVFLAMGFTGKEAAQWKEAYIEAFNQMEGALLHPGADDPTLFHVSAEELAALVEVRLKNRLAKTRYHYPRQLLEQDYFVAPKSTAPLSLSMLGNTAQYVSPLFALLDELQAHGHDVSAPADEATAMRDAIRRADSVLEQISHLSLTSRFTPASTALKNRRLK